MAVTDTEQAAEQREERSEAGEPETAERTESAEKAERTEADRSSEPEDGESDQPEAGESEAPEGESKESAKRNRIKGIAGGAGIFLVLGIYFAWIGNEMGSHAISGTFEIWAIFGAIFLGVAALVAGGAISRRKNDD